MVENECLVQPITHHPKCMSVAVLPNSMRSAAPLSVIALGKLKYTTRLSFSGSWGVKGGEVCGRRAHNNKDNTNYKADHHNMPQGPGVRQHSPV